MSFQFDALGTLTVATLVFWCGLFLRSRISALREYSIPAPLIGGVPFALLRWALMGHLDLTFDLAVKGPLMIIFFTTLGLGAGLKLLKRTGPRLVLFLGLCVCLVVMQNVVAMMISRAMGLHPLLGLLAGSATMSGGHGTGALFAYTLAGDLGLMGGMEWAMATATFGAIAGSVVGGPVARALILRHRLKPVSPVNSPAPKGHAQVRPLSGKVPQTNANNVHTTILQVLVAMFLGSLVSSWLKTQGITFPCCLGALFVGALLRNFADITHKLRVNPECVDFIGSVALCLFLAMAIMSLELWRIVDMAGPLAVILIAETLLMILFAYLATFRFMGKDFEAAIMAGGHCGFGLGAASNSVANMGTLCSRYGPAPEAFFIVPISAVFFIDLINVFVIQAFVTFLG